MVERFHDAVAEITDALAAHAKLSPSSLGTSLTIAYDYDVATHLFSAASGLESSVPGETEVLGQVRRAHERALEDQVSGPVLNELFRAAVHAGKRVRTETPISRGTTSFAHASVALAAEHFDGTFAGLRIGIVGAGDLGSGVIEALSGLNAALAPTSIVVVNRTKERAEAVLEQIDLPEVLIEAAEFSGFASVLDSVDVVITAIESEDHLITRELVERRTAPLLVVDLGMPRNADPTIRELAEISVIDVGDLGRKVKASLEHRRDEIEAASRIVNDEVHRYRDVARARGAAPVIAALRSRFDEQRMAELDRRRSEFSDLSDDQWERVSALTRSMYAKTLHEPTMVVRDTAGTPKGERLVEALRALFGI